MSEYARLVVAVDSTQVKTAERDLQSLGAQSGQTESAVASLASKAAAAFGTIKLGGLIKDATLASSRFDQLGIVMGVVGRNAGLSQSQVARYAKEVESMGISMTESRQTVIRMTQAQMDLTKASDLARLAQDAAVIANTNSSDALGRLIYGLQSGQVEILRNMGLNVNFAASYSKMAAEMGVTVDRLTEVDKVQARTNAVMEAGIQIAGAYDASMQNANKALGSTTRHVQNLQVALGAVWQGEFSGGVDAYSSALKVLGENADTVAQVLKTGVYAAAGLATGALAKKTVATVSAMLAAKAQAAEELRLAQAQAASTGSTLAKLQATFKLTGATTGLTAATAAHEAALKRQAVAQAASVGIGRTLLGVMGGPVGLGLTVSAVALSFVDWGGATAKARKNLIDINMTVDDSIAKFNELGEAQRRVQQSTWVTEQAKALKEARSAIDEYSQMGRNALTQLGVEGINAADAFREMVNEVRRGERAIDSVTEWFTNQDTNPAFVTMLENSAAAFADSSDMAEHFAKLLGTVENQTSATAKSTDELAGAVGANAEEWEKYIDRLAEVRDLVGATAAAEAEYRAIKMGATSEQVAHARVLAEQADTLREYERAVRSGSTAEQERLQSRLTALLLEEDAVKAAAAAEEEAIQSVAAAEESGAGRQVAAIQRTIDQTMNLVRAKNILLIDPPQQSLSGLALLTSGLSGATVAGSGLAVTAETVEQRVERMLKQIRAGATVSKSATSETKKLDDAFKSLMATLYPAEAAWDKYNEQLEELQKRLKGDQLAKAVDRLTRSFSGGDADGAANAIAAYIEELQDLEDKINPAGRAAREFREEQAKLRAEIERSGDPTGKWTRLLEENERQMRENTRVTNQWTEWTESALERVDSAFADAWRNIGDGFSSFRDSLTNAFKQMLAELAHMAITRPIIMQIGAAMGIGGGTQGQNGVWGSLLGGGGSSGGLGGALQVANQGRGLLSAYGTAQGMFPALQGGWASGGFGGALQSGGSYIGSLFGVGSGAAASSAAGSTAAGYTGQAYATWLASQGAGAAGAGAGASSAISSALSGVSSMMTNPVTWIAAGMLASNKLYSDGVRADGSAIRAQYSDSGSSGAAKALGGITSIVADITKWTDRAMDPAGIFGRAVPILTGSPLTQAVNMGIARLFGGGEQFKRTVGSASGSYSGGEYTGAGAVEGFYGGSRRFGDDFDGALHDLASMFSSSLGGLFDMFDIDSTIETEVTGRLRRTSGRLAADFYATIEDELVHVFGQYGRKGNVGESMEAFFDDVMGRGLVEAIAASSLPEYLKELTAGLTEAEEVSDTISSLITRFTTVRDVVELLNLSTFEMTDAGLRGADALIAMSGGLESLVTSTATYYDQFFSAAEKQADTIEAVEKAFAAADITLADSRESYRAMVEDIDVTTEAGQQMFAAMMGLAGQAAQYFDILDARAAQSVAMLAAGLDASLGALQRSIAAQQKRVQDAHAARIGSLNDMAATASSSISALTSISNSLDAAVRRLRGTSDDATRSLRAQAVMTLNSALVSARSGQSLAGFDGLQDALDVASQMDTALYSSLVDFEREQGRTANLIAELEKVNGKQLSAEERLLQLVQGQISAAERQFESEMAGLAMQLAYAQSQVDALNGIDNSIMGVAAAVAAMNASVVAALKGLPRGSAQANTPANNLSIVDTAYRTVLGREVDASGRQYWSERLQSGSLEYDQFAETLARAALQNPTDHQNSKSNALKYLQGLGIPGFASGGVFGGGLRLVGEQGPELEVTGPSRIYSAGQTASLLSGSGNAETVAELRQLRTEIHNDLRAIAKHTQQTARRVEYLERWDYDGLPQEREIA